MQYTSCTFFYCSINRQGEQTTHNWQWWDFLGCQLFVKVHVDQKTGFQCHKCHDPVKIALFSLKTPLLTILSDKAVCWSHKEKYNIKANHSKYAGICIVIGLFFCFHFQFWESGFHWQILVRESEEGSEENSLYTATSFPQEKSEKGHLWFTVLIIYGNNFAKFLKN